MSTIRIEHQRFTPVIGTLDPADWTTEEIASHVVSDARRLIDVLETAKHLHETDKILNDLQNYHGKIRSWLQLYGALTKQEIVA